MTALCVWYSQHVSDSDMSWHGAAGEQLQCVYYYYYYYRNTAIRVCYPRWIKALRGSGLIQHNFFFSVQWLRRWAGLTPIHTLEELYYLLIYLSLCDWMIRQNTGETGTSSWLSNTERLFSTEPCYFLVIWHWRQPVTSTALPHSLWNWLGCIFLQTFGLFTYLQMFTKAALHWFFKNTVMKMLSHHQLKRSKVICTWLVNIFIFTRCRLSPSN